uniref:ATP-binding subunit of ABC transporter n=1 Tax=Heterosigma akashiwo TaxID=2829 RepID=A0A224AMX8_HETAK|nr:ATP-binding subunit of ABC transporter [Heterosigma akashiwo]BBA18343.1 ATP-binding subunit of ABC transporter [Heterosigma akashiwo]BBA18482.1 ATP-binding subunit of ABC transporter [Heterosigma akashiwo]BBA18620.1 ATP-binding subunit of ABC transporter [Heterosigma akashiwo]BBA18759.1 ATP-binding subunit of ABC transporter [Heterosigma akashiwo]
MIIAALSSRIILLNPVETSCKASISSPESVSSKIASCESNSASCRISFRFFSPPENPSFTLRSKNFGFIPTIDNLSDITL